MSKNAEKKAKDIEVDIQKKRSIGVAKSSVSDTYFAYKKTRVKDVGKPENIKKAESIEYTLRGSFDQVYNLSSKISELLEFRCL
jgi:hypothetical protein